jgi:hypothetical protein
MNATASASANASPIEIECQFFRSSVRLFVEDLMQWFQSFVTTVQSIPYPSNKLPGFLEVDETNIDRTLSSIEGSIRRR